MNYLIYLHNGQITDWIFSRDGEFTTDERTSHIEALAAALGVPPADITSDVVTVAPAPTVMVPAIDPVIQPTASEVDAGALATFIASNPDPATWTNAQLRDGLIRLIKIELRRRRLIA